MKHIVKKHRIQFDPDGVYVYRIRNVRTGVERVWSKHNLTPDIAFVTLAKNAMQDFTYNVFDDPYICLGTTGDSPVVGNTQLGTEVQRKACSVVSRNANEIEFSTFWNVGEAVGTWREQGLMASGGHTQATSSLNSGILWSHVDENFTVAAEEETLTVSFYLTFQRP